MEGQERLKRYEGALLRGKYRYQDLLWCNKDDDCHIMAEGAALALDDIFLYLKGGIHEKLI